MLAETINQEWNYRLPRFLFRGFNSHSGGDSGLNRSRMIQPHAFYGTHNKVEPWPWDQGGKPVTSLSLEELQRDVNGHLVGSLVQSHFSSWAADFHTALSYAGAGDSSMIAVLDTTLCGTRTAVYHVPALMAAGVACGKYPHEYLVYGPVIGAAYCCFVPVPSLITEGLRSYHFDSAAVETPVTISDLDQASNVASLFRHENYKTAGPALFLTVFAAELSRLKRPNRLFPQRSAKSPWSLNDTATILRYLDPRIYDAALFSHEPLVNRDTYVDRFEQLRCMVDLLATVEEEIRKKRREWLVMTEYDPNAGHLAGPQSSTRGAKRKSDCPGSSQSRPKRADMSKRGRPRGCDQPLIRAAGLEKGTSGSLLPAGVKRHKRAKRRAQ